MLKSHYTIKTHSQINTDLFQQINLSNNKHIHSNTFSLMIKQGNDRRERKSFIKVVSKDNKEKRSQNRKSLLSLTLKENSKKKQFLRNDSLTKASQKTLENLSKSIIQIYNPTQNKQNNSRLNICRSKKEVPKKYGRKSTRQNIINQNIFKNKREKYLTLHYQHEPTKKKTNSAYTPHDYLIRVEIEDASKDDDQMSNPFYID